MTRDDDRFAEAVALANVPTLLMVLVQRTGDRRWLEDPTAPSGPGAWATTTPVGCPSRSKPVAIPEPDFLVEMLACAMGEPVPDEYESMIAAQLGITTEVPPAIDADFDVLVIGAGVSGLCAGVHLQRSGVRFTIVEKNSTVGGTWLENRYPGAGVDTPDHLYSRASTRPSGPAIWT